MNHKNEQLLFVKSWHNSVNWLFFLLCDVFLLKNKLLLRFHFIIVILFFFLLLGDKDGSPQLTRGAACWTPTCLWRLTAACFSITSDTSDLLFGNIWHQEDLGVDHRGSDDPQMSFFLRWEFLRAERLLLSLHVHIELFSDKAGCLLNYACSQSVCVPNEMRVA